MGAASVKVGIVEDELLIARSISQALIALGYEVTEPAINYTEALGMIVTERPDILLLDIQLKGHKDGIDLAQTVKGEFDIPFIFLTANADAATVDRAKEVRPGAYLVKPFSKDELYAAIEVCLHNFSTGEHTEIPESTGESPVIKDSLFIKQGHKYQKVKISDILYIESSDVYIYVHTIGVKYLVRSSIQQFIHQLNSPDFLRVHKSYVVNVHHIDTVTLEEITVNKVEIPVGRAYKDAVVHFLERNTGG